MGFGQAVGTCFKKYFTVSGRASRSEFWWWTLFLVGGSFLYSFTSSTLVSSVDPAELQNMELAALGSFLLVGGLFSLITFIPTLTVTVRRLHDIGRTGFWVVVPWLLNAAMLWAMFVTGGGGQGGNLGDLIFGSMMILGIGLASLILSIVLFIWMLKAGTRGDNYFGPDPRGDRSYEDEYAGTQIPTVARTAQSRAAAAPSAPAMSHREEVHALYQQRVLGRQGPGPAGTR